MFYAAVVDIICGVENIRFYGASADLPKHRIEYHDCDGYTVLFYIYN